jgi:hypothetical protein
MQRTARYIIVGLILTLVLPLGSLQHVLAERAQVEAEVSDCGCPSEKSHHPDDPDTNDCSSDCHCACHITLQGAMINLDNICETDCVAIPDDIHQIPASRFPPNIDRPPIHSS